MSSNLIAVCTSQCDTPEGRRWADLEDSDTENNVSESPPLAIVRYQHPPHSSESTPTFVTKFKI